MALSAVSNADSSKVSVINALVFDGESAELTEGSLHIENGVVAEIGGPTPAGAHVIDAQGRTVIPGLIDAHFHAYAISLDTLSLEMTDLSYLALAATKRLGSALRRGFTTVRDVAGGDAGLGRAITEGIFPSPRYFYTGPALSQTGGHGDVRTPEQSICLHDSRMSELVDGADDLRRAVRERFRIGAHAIKVMTSGGVISQVDPIRVPQYSIEELRVVVTEAQRRGSYVAAHAYSPEAIAHSVNAGIRSIEHGNLLDQETAELMAANDAYLVPTLAAYDAMDRRGADYGITAVSAGKNKEVLNAGKDAILHARAAGVSIGFGSDLMGELENDQLIGLRLQVEVDGVLNALRSATSVNSALLGHPELGHLRVGSAADLVILNGNPFDKPSVLWDESSDRTVMAAGKLVS